MPSLACVKLHHSHQIRCLVGSFVVWWSKMFIMVIRGHVSFIRHAREMATIDAGLPKKFAETLNLSLTV